ncbi:amino acid ABC transporter substrate-binding protein [Ramlibacter tataouinensis]|uniref:Amino acid ABC transporter substrate-binding protein n=1 Tax=Ramlibacter tataouinensis TaxID=94132 RepID=A0A127JZH5_9BURK|nr:amino acid ABC transporter substrate-binding protein [Ramlibacter tataouinensis]
MELRRIHKEFGAFTALQAIDLGIRQGEFVCFLGPSGCGKTTLLRIIAGLEVQTSGEVWQNGRDISRLPPAQRDYGIVFQSYALFPNLTVADNVAYGLVNRRVPRTQIEARVAELLKLVGLPGSQKKYPGQLSGGQQQRIALARALATSPGLLLLDEPLSALDALERVRLRQEIRALQQKVGVTTIMVTHDQEEALSVADRIVVMNQGAIEQAGTPLDIYREPASPFVADFVGKVNVLPARIAGGELRVGALHLPCEGEDREARVYLRPEDVLARPIAEGDAHVFDAEIEKIEFLGSYCHVKVASPALDQHRLTVYLSLNYLSERSLSVGSPLKLKLLPERIKVF